MIKVRILKGIILALALNNMAAAKPSQLIKISYINQQQKVPPALSNLDEFIQFKGMQGAELAVEDNNTTGQFTGQRFELSTLRLPVDADVVTQFRQQVKDDVSLVISNLPADKLKQLADLESSKNKLFFDATTLDDDLRNQQCRENVLHLLPSRAMRADALAQYMMKKRWSKWFLVSGVTDEDKLYAKAVKRALRRYGLKLVAEKQWTHSYDARRTAQSDIPVFTQGVEYDVLVVVDEQGLFGEYLEYRTWKPRPVIGTQGLLATSWHPTHEQWGAVQIQNRFKSLAGRAMTEQDYGAYLAVRAIGEAAVRTQSNQMLTIKQFLLGDEFALQGYKGKPLSFRNWNGQLRQPVLLAAARSLVTAAPLEGFLHPKTELDTLGYDQAESLCNRKVTDAKHVIAVKQSVTSETEQNAKAGLQQLIDRIKNYYSTNWK